MKLTLLRASLALTALVPLGSSLYVAASTPQDGGQDEVPGAQVDLYGRPLQKATDDLAVRMRGCWLLTDLDNREWPTAGRDLLGYLLVTDGFLAFEVQAFWETRLQEIPDAFQTFIARFAADKTGKVRSESLVGSFLDREQGTLEWEDPGLPREFEAVMPSNSRLELIWGNNSRMTFERLPGINNTAASFYGRPAESDFGIERDIFGRPAKPKPGEDKEGDDK